MGNSSSQPIKLDSENVKIFEGNGQSYILTKSDSEFAHFCKLLDIAEIIEERILLGYYRLSESSSDTDDYDSDNGSDKISSPEEEEEQETIEEEGLSYPQNNILKSVRHRIHRVKSTKEADLPNVKEKVQSTWIRVNNEQVYKAFTLFKYIRGVDGSLIFGLRDKYDSKLNNKNDNENENEKEEEIYKWYKKNFTYSLEVAILNNACIEKSYSALKYLVQNIHSEEEAIKPTIDSLHLIKLLKDASEAVTEIEHLKNMNKDLFTFDDK